MLFAYAITTYHIIDLTTAMGGSESTLSAAKSAAGSQLNPQPVFINDEKKHKVTVFMSPDHSIQPLADFIMSATKSVDLYIPGMYIFYIS